MRIQEVIEYMESWAPAAAALPRDNPGLQVGDPAQDLKNILVTLEVTDRIIEEAIENQANLILTHHPLIFAPFSSLDASSGLGGKIAALLKNEISVYAAHTNLDAAPDGVSVILAGILEINKPRFLSPPAGQWLKKLVVFVPAEHVDDVRQAMAKAGAGVIGDYTHCSFNIPGSGTFFGTEAASPRVGKKGALERVEEVRLEMILPAWKTVAVLAAMKASHPYEEVAYDLYPLENCDVNFGFGAIGELERSVSLMELVGTVKRKLGVKTVGVVEGPAERFSRLAVCGGSGGDLVGDAWRQGADAFITGEMKYHQYLEYEDRLTIIVAGHYATERVILPVWVKRLQEWLGKEQVSVIETKMLTNPLKFFV